MYPHVLKLWCVIIFMQIINHDNYFKSTIKLVEGYGQGRLSIKGKNIISLECTQLLLK